MPIPHGKTVDTLIGFRDVDPHPAMPGVRAEHMEGVHPHAYMFNDIPAALTEKGDPAVSIGETLAKMDKFGIEWGVVSLTSSMTPLALRSHPDRFVATLGVDGNKGMDAVRAIVAAKADYDIRGVTIFPSGVYPPVPINDKHWYPIYAKCIELDIPVFCAVGVPGPRVPFMAQWPGHLDEVCYDFPELKLIMRHGAEPWADLAVKLMLKWPNLYYSTSGFAPKYIPKEVIQFANTRGRDKFIYAGYFPFGLELERTFDELEQLPLKDEVWPAFLSGNARRLLKLPD
jgi:predicted TIM-barrel fold metal-dependent hydrolase